MREPDETSDDCCVVCPWCGHKRPDARELASETIRLMRCDGCDNRFACWSETEVTYHAAPVPREQPRDGAGAAEEG